MEALILSFIQANPGVASILVIVGGLRLILKPTFVYLHQVFQSFNLTSYDQKATAVEQSKPVQFLYFILDYVASIKVPVKVDEPPKAP